MNIFKSKQNKTKTKNLFILENEFIILGLFCYYFLYSLGISLLLLFFLLSFGFLIVGESSYFKERKPG